MDAPATASKEYFDLSYSDEPASHYILLLEINPSCLRACWYHKSKNLITGFAEYPLDLDRFESSFDELLKSYPFLRSEFDQCLITVRNGNHALIPHSMDKDDHEAFFRLTNNLSENERLISYSFVGINAFMMNAVAINIAHRLDEKMVHARMIPHFAPRIEQALNDLKHSQRESMMLIDVAEEHVNIAAFKDRRLQLSNSFYQSGIEDIAYFALYCAEILELDPEHDLLIVSGDIQIGSEIWITLSNYWKHIQQAAALEHLQLSAQLNPDEISRFTYLSHSLLCAS